MSMRGYPDWGLPMRIGNTPGWAGFEEPGIVLLPYAALTAAPVLPTADVTVDVFGQDQGEAGIVEFGLVTVGFALTAHHVPEETGDLLARLAPVGRGLVRLTAPAALGLAEGLLRPEEFLPATGRTLTTTLRLGGTEAEILVAALQRDLRALGATAWIEMPGVAERAPGAMTVEVHRFLAEVREVRSDGVMTRDDLAAFVTAGSPTVVVTTTSDPSDADAARALTNAVVDRLVGHLGTFVPPPDAGTAGAWSLPEPGAAATATWDLASTILAPRSVRVATDPVIDSTGTGLASVDVRRHDAAGLPDGRHRITVRATVPDSPVGVLDVGIDLTAPAAPPHRPFPVQAGVRLADVWAAPTRTTEVELALGPGEPLAYALRATSILQTSSGLVPVAGPARQVTDDSTPVVTPDDLGLRFLPVQATASLLDRAEVTVTVSAELTADLAAEAAEPGGVRYEAIARLDRAGPIAHLTLPVAATEPSVVAAAVDRATQRATEALSLPVGGLLLDLFTFPDPPWETGPGTSPPLEPTMTSLELAGLRLTPLSETDWAFAPLTAGVARTPDGRVQLALMETGDSGHLAVTTTLLATDAQQEEARTALVRDHGAGERALTLVPEDVRATNVSLQLHGSDGTWTTIDSADPSGTFLQECAFSVPLDAQRLDVVRRATKGQADLLRVIYELESHPRAAASTGAGGSSAGSSSSSTTSSTTTSSITVTTTRTSSSGSEPVTSATTHHDEETTTAATSAAPHRDRLDGHHRRVVMGARAARLTPVPTPSQDIGSTLTHPPSRKARPMLKLDNVRIINEHQVHGDDTSPPHVLHPAEVPADRPAGERWAGAAVRRVQRAARGGRQEVRRLRRLRRRPAPSRETDHGQPSRRSCDDELAQQFPGGEPPKVVPAPVPWLGGAVKLLLQQDGKVVEKVSRRCHAVAGRQQRRLLLHGAQPSSAPRSSRRR